MAERVRIGIVGAGWWATTNHLPILARRLEVELVGVCRLGEAELRQVQEKFGFDYATENYEEMIGKCALDGVVISSPHHLHFGHAEKALRAGAHVMVEKPMTTNSVDARALVAIAEKAKREILVPHGWNFRSYVDQARDLVRSGAIGEVQHVTLQMASPAAALFNGEPYPGTEHDMFRPASSTWADAGHFGGYGWGQLPHLLACLFRIADDLEPESVFAFAGSSKTGVDMFDGVAIRFRGDKTGALSGAGTVPMNSRFQVDLRLFGTAGVLMLDIEGERLRVLREDGKHVDVRFAAGTGDYECIEPVHRFVDICLGRAVDNAANGSIGRKSVEVIEAIYRSRASGRAEAA
jgi:predicted dehydrogenase